MCTVTIFLSSFKVGEVGERVFRSNDSLRYLAVLAQIIIFCHYFFWVGANWVLGG